MDFIERLSTIMGKQYLFKQHDGTYYNKYVGEYQSQTEVEDWLYEELSGKEYKHE